MNWTFTFQHNYEWIQATRSNSPLLSASFCGDKCHFFPPWEPKLLKQKLAAITEQEQSFKVRSHHLLLHYPVKQKVVQFAWIISFSKTLRLRNNILTNLLVLYKQKKTHLCVLKAVAERVNRPRANQCRLWMSLTNSGWLEHCLSRILSY